MKSKSKAELKSIEGCLHSNENCCFLNSRRRRGIAALTALGVAAILSLLAVVCLTLVGWRTEARAREQRALQALWNARAGREHYLATGRVTPELSLDSSDPKQLCRTYVGVDGTLTFEGLSHGVRRQLLCLQGDPSRVTEVP